MNSTFIYKAAANAPFKWIVRGLSLIVVAAIMEKMLKKTTEDEPREEKFAANCEKDPTKCSAYWQCLVGHRVIDSRVPNTCEVMRRRFRVKVCPPTPEQIVLRREIKQILEGTEAPTLEKK
jgi:hypothetical protein